MLSYRSGWRLLDSVAPGGAVAVSIQGHILRVLAKTGTAVLYRWTWS